MWKNWLIVAFIFKMVFNTGFAQPTHVVNDPEKALKQMKDHFVKGEYGFAYPLARELQSTYTAEKSTDAGYLFDEVNYYTAVLELILQLPVGVSNAETLLSGTMNPARRQLLHYHLAHHYFLEDDFNNTITHYTLAGQDNLDNDAIATAKFEKAYAHFNLKQFEAAKPLFNEIFQLPDSKYHLAASYYYGFICYHQGLYAEAIKAFRLIEANPAYSGVVPYYLSELYYFQGMKEDALRYGESVLARGGNLYYEKELKLLIGQLYFEKKEFAIALPLLRDYVAASEKVSKEVMYELSYCYYKANYTEKAIEGFRQLSNEKDSMGQNSMYLLGNLYLKQDDKPNARIAFQYCAFNSSNAQQQQTSRFNYAKLSFELGYQDIALREMRSYLKDYSTATDADEAKEILLSLLANTNNFTDALEMYKQFGQPTTAMQKMLPRIQFGLAMDFLNDQRLDEASGLLQSILKNPQAGGTLPYAHFWNAEIAYRQNRYDEAIRGYQSFLEARAQPVGEANAQTAQYNSGYCWFQKGDYKNALTQFESVTKTVNSNSSSLIQDAYVRVADCYYMLRDYQNANIIYTKVIKLSLPASDHALYQQAMITGIKNPSEKINLLNKLTAQYPTSNLVAEADMEIANSYLADEKFAAAVPYLNKLINQKSAEGLKPKAYLKLALAHYNNNQNGDALKAYDALIENYPQSAEAMEAIGLVKNIYVEEGKPDAYIELMARLGKPVSMNEADSLAYASAILKAGKADCNTTVAAFQAYLMRFPDGASALVAHQHIGECYVELKNYAEAIKSYQFIFSKGVSSYFDEACSELARLQYVEYKDYPSARKYYESLYQNTNDETMRLDALRGWVRCNYQLKDYQGASSIASQLLSRIGISTDDKSIAALVLGKSQQATDCSAAITSFKTVAAINKSAWGAEARYEMASCYFQLKQLRLSEKAAMTVIKETGSYDYWVTKAYILIGDIFMEEKDYFNAKATYESVSRNANIEELKTIATDKFQLAVDAESKNTKIANP
jgi:tetratricopeptide (TPR) repeat protein